MSVKLKRFNICLPKDLVCSLDAAAKTEYVSRSAYIREAIELRIRLDEHIASEVSNTESYFSILKAAHSRRLVKRHINQYKPDGHG